MAGNIREVPINVMDNKGNITKAKSYIVGEDNMSKNNTNKLNDEEREIQLSSLRATVKHYDEKIKEYESKKDTAVKLINKITQGEV